MRDTPRILAVDDEARGVELVKRILRKTAAVETATSGEAAWAVLQEREFDLVISDHRMPGTSGVELLARVAEQFPFTGRILITGYAEAVDTVEAINRARVHAYLNKPCPPDQLSLTVGSVLERVETLRDNARLADLLRSRGPGSLRAGPIESILEELAVCVRAVRQEISELERSADGGSPTLLEPVGRLRGASERVDELAEELLEAARDKV
ncbi:MAG: response regulator [Myxococcota bacterium]|nr:response regulator [Myxococcota bacterium]